MDFKDNIEHFYEQVKPVAIIKPELALRNIADTIIFDLMDNGIDVQDVDKIVLEVLRKKDDIKFKQWIIHQRSNKCFLCGSRKNIELHHIKPVVNYPELKYDVDNVVLLCCACHQAVETGGGTHQKIKGGIMKFYKDVLNRKITADLNNKLKVSK